MFAPSFTSLCGLGPERRQRPLGADSVAKGSDEGLKHLAGWPSLHGRRHFRINPFELYTSIRAQPYPFRQNRRILHSMPKSLPRRGLSEGDLPPRLTVAAVSRERFHYVILRKDGTVLEASSRSYPSEVVARAAGLPELRRRSIAAK